MNTIIPFVLAVSLAACANTKAEFKVDGSSAASTEKSLQKISRSLNDKQRVEFTIALLQIQLSETKSVMDLLNNQSLQSTNYQFLATKLDGLTYAEILELAKQSPTQIEHSSH